MQEQSSDEGAEALAMIQQLRKGDSDEALQP